MTLLLSGYEEQHVHPSHGFIPVITCWRTARIPIPTQLHDYYGKKTAGALTK